MVFFVFLFFEGEEEFFLKSQYTLQETNISPKNGILKMIFLFPRWDMLIPWRVSIVFNFNKLGIHVFVVRYQPRPIVISELQVSGNSVGLVSSRNLDK